MNRFLSSVALGALCLLIAGPVGAQSSSTSVPLNITVTDGKTNIQPGNSVIYVVTVQQTEAQEVTGTLELTLPTHAELISANKGGDVVGTTVRWTNQEFQKNQSYSYTIQVRYKTSTPNGEILQATARVGSSAASDTTIVGTAHSSASVGQQGTFTVTLSDEKDTVRAGDNLTYTINVTNGTTTDMITEVRLRLPAFVDSSTINPAGSTRQSTDVVWGGQAFGQNETKTYTVTATVQPRTTNYVTLTAQAIAGSASATDNTTVNPASNTSSSEQASSSSQASVSNNPSGSRAVLFVKEASKAEAVPGDVIHYVLFVQNVLLTTINDAVITDRFDPAQLSVEDAGGATSVTNGELRWVLPTLAPGEVWQRSYVLRVSDALGQGADISNVATIAGSDVETATLSEKVSTVKTGIVTYLPETGAAYDRLFVLLSIALSSFAVLGQKRSI